MKNKNASKIEKPSVNRTEDTYDWDLITTCMQSFLANHGLLEAFPEAARKDLGKFYVDNIKNHVQIYQGIMNEN